MRFSFLFFIVLITFASLAGSAIADGKTYDKCVQRFSGNMPPKAMKSYCSCVQEKTDLYVAGKITKKQFRASAPDCLGSNQQAEIFVKGFLESCLDDPKRGSNPAYQDYCYCVASGYQDRLKGHSFPLDKNVESAMNKAVISACIPSKHR